MSAPQTSVAGPAHVDGPTIRYGVIGTGMMGVEHIENVNALAGGEVIAISDPDPTSLAAGVAAAPDGVAAVADHRDLLAIDEVDAVVVVTPNHTHLDVVSDVLAAGKHVLIEKPLCTTIEDCQTLIERAAGAPGVIQVGLEYRWMPPVARLIEEVAGGAVGQIRMVFMREHRFPFLVKVGNWNRFSAKTGGTLVEKCCHFFDLMNVIVGERPTRVMASGAQDVNHLDETYDGQPADVLDNAYVIVEYPGGARACLDLCMFADATANSEEVTVVGDRGKVEALIPEGVLRIGERGRHWIGDVDVELVSTDHVAFAGLHHGSSYLEHEAFLAAIRGGTEPPVTLADGLWSVAMGVAAHRSIDEGRPIVLDEILTTTDGEAR